MTTNLKTALQEKMLQICKKHKIADSEIPEYGRKPDKFDLFPYAPYVPKHWNKILVLAESQQLRGLNKGNEGYRQSLLGTTYEDLIFRLGREKITGNKPDVQIGITPWDEGYLKLAVLSCFSDYTAGQYAVSNAIPWHLDKDNKKQAAYLKRKSIVYWKDVLPMMQPKIIICTGNIADSIITDTGYCAQNICTKFHIRSASQLHFVAKKTFRWNDYLKKNPAIKEVYEKNKNLIDPDEPERYFVWYISHAVKIIKPSTEKSF